MRNLLFFSILILSSCGTLDRFPSGSGSSRNCLELASEILYQSPIQKARQINDEEGLIKGSFAEIGAGQGVAGTFFQAQRASETIVKSISAYGKEESDRLYGPGVRYVSRPRLKQMLEVEYNALKGHREIYANNSRLFAFANTVTTNKSGQGHGWVGLSFQQGPGSRPTQLYLHVRLLSDSVETQHEDLATLGVNLIHAAFYRQNNGAETFIQSLTEGLRTDRIVIDLFDVEGRQLPPGLTSRLLNQNYDQIFREATFWDSNGLPEVPGDLFYRKTAIFSRSDNGQISELMNSLDEPILVRLRENSAAPTAQSGTYQWTGPKSRPIDILASGYLSFNEQNHFILRGEDLTEFESLTRKEFLDLEKSAPEKDKISFYVKQSEAKGRRLLLSRLRSLGTLTIK